MTTLFSLIKIVVSGEDFHFRFIEKLVETLLVRNILMLNNLKRTI